MAATAARCSTLEGVLTARQPPGQPCWTTVYHRVAKAWNAVEPDAAAGRLLTLCFCATEQVASTLADNVLTSPKQQTKVLMVKPVSLSGERFCRL